MSYFDVGALGGQKFLSPNVKNRVWEKVSGDVIKESLRWWLHLWIFAPRLTLVNFVQTGVLSLQGDDSSFTQVGKVIVVALVVAQFVPTFKPLCGIHGGHDWYSVNGTTWEV